MEHWWCRLCFAAITLATAAAVMGGHQAAVPQPDAAVVFVQHKGRSARIEGTKNDKLGYYSFFGLRYAEPPVGSRRFQRPFRRFLKGEISALKTCAACPHEDPKRTGHVIGQEDCLCLNIYAPKMPGEENGSPVVFFIHGGNYKSGSASYYGGQHLVQKDTILVAVQYRLASLGFLSTGEREAAGNAGLFDVYAALEWVKEYIEFFGGDPTRIVVMGQGSGGSAASLLALSGKGRGATGVAALSGAPLSTSAVRLDPDRHARALANATNCPHKPAEQLIACLRTLSAENIVLADSKIQMNMVDTEKFLEEIAGRSGAGARVEGEEDNRGLPTLISESPATSLQKKLQRCPLLTGVTSAETSKAVFGKYSGFLKDKLSNVRDFIKSEVVSGLRGLVGGIQDLIPIDEAAAIIPGIPVADYYQALFDNSLSAVDGLSQVAEATTDALFNFPAYQSVSLWSKKAPAFLYSFEHSGNLTKGAHFLPGVPLAGNIKDLSNAGPAHGDELAYIFEPLDEEGNSVAGDISEDDAKVRDNFVSLIARFAHELSPLENKNKTKSFLGAYSQESDPFIKIGKELTLEKQFRFCQMGLWGNMADRLTGVLCRSVFGNILKKLQIPSIPKELPKLPTIVPNLPLPFMKATKKTTGIPNATTKRRSFFDLSQ